VTGYAVIMKIKEGVRTWILVFLGISSLILSHFFLRQNGIIYEHLPKLFLFNNTLETYHGDIFFHYFKVITTVSLLLIFLFVYSLIDSHKSLVKIKKDFKVFLFVFFILIIFLPWVLLLCDYVTFLIGFKLFEDAKFYFPFGPIIVLGSYFLIQISIDSFRK
jgi:hypothetical protein